MKILFVADSYYPHINGVYYFVQRLALRLKNEGHEVAVIAPSESMRHSQTAVDGINVFGIASFSLVIYRSIRLPIPFLLKKHLRQLVEEFNPDIIHIQNHFSLNKALINANKKYGYPVIGTNHFMTENFTSFIRSAKWKKILEKWIWSGFAKVFNRTLAVTTPSQTAARLIRAKLKVDVIAISNGIDLKKFYPKKFDESSIRKKYGIPGKPILLYVGRLDPEKHIDEILEAVAQDQNQTDFCFVLVGKGVKRSSLELQAKQLKIEDRVIFAGFVSDEDLLSLYQASRCFITASIAELQSIATMEAMASGLPVIAANAGALGELVHHEKNGYLFEPGDIASLTKYIHSVFTNDSLFYKMKELSLQYIAPHDISNTVQQYLQLYKTYSAAPVLQISHQL